MSSQPQHVQFDAECWINSRWAATGSALHPSLHSLVLLTSSLCPCRCPCWREEKTTRCRTVSPGLNWLHWFSYQDSVGLLEICKFLIICSFRSEVCETSTFCEAIPKQSRRVDFLCCPAQRWVVGTTLLIYLWTFLCNFKILGCLCVWRGFKSNAYHTVLAEFRRFSTYFHMRSLFWTLLLRGVFL